MANPGALASSQGIMSTVVEAYLFTVATTTCTTTLSGGGNSDATVNLTVAAITGFAQGQLITLEPNTVKAETAFITVAPTGTNITVVPTNSAGWVYPHSGTYTVVFSVLSPGGVIRDASTYANTAGVDSSGRLKTLSAPSPVGIGGDFLISSTSQPSTNGIALTVSQAQPSGSVGCSLLVPPSGSITVTVATSAPGGAPATSRVYGNPSTAVAPIEVDIDLSGTAMVYVLAITGTCIGRWL
jgi:hypothetical protein